ncbi:hypothetical protein C5C66_00435 [Rathayibacter toxicus]|uniref:LPXTG cell wall anchor domain-containing protein n=1 Tax=Rathayibacter toxicus TaxID=145458 RepID=A0A0C5BCI0_9MICO|nr:hypothetical protein [Rathayibacter toxicus]AJM76881.1 hypothetical protein TI83_00625 [Rathayibacter toxicus]ALS57351.1 hypothetical protein APU90_05855 [Rathayibacter toxicus]KKM45683.1 hypothetical protein VT73_05855 [Rathayibacter toxicus]PPG24773.1 hypothetical protein C5D15_00435 [Rathayibacter toxicus]PPG48227.1 hypothetical protein C5D16_00445 [Rathayibacter toxicus]
MKDGSLGRLSLLDNIKARLKIVQVLPEAQLKAATPAPGSAPAPGSGVAEGSAPAPAPGAAEPATIASRPDSAPAADSSLAATGIDSVGPIAGAAALLAAGAAALGFGAFRRPSSAESDTEENKKHRKGALNCTIPPQNFRGNCYYSPRIQTGLA